MVAKVEKLGKNFIFCFDGFDSMKTVRNRFLRTLLEGLYRVSHEWLKIIELKIVEVKCNKFYYATFFDNGPGFRDMRGLRRMGCLGRLQEFFLQIFQKLYNRF